MIRQSYIEFIEKFEGLNPYELDHLCRVIHQQYQVQMQESKTDLGPKEFWKIMTSAMQAAQIELAEKKLKEAELNLQLVKSKVYQYPKL